MPTVFYTQAEYESLEKDNQILAQRARAAEAMRPQWAQGHSSDSMAAQVSAAALQQVWDHLGVTTQSACMDALRELAP